MDPFRYAPDVLGEGLGVLGVPAVQEVAGVELLLAERLPARGAVLAGSASVPEPGYRHPVALLDLRDRLPDALVAGDERELRLDRPVAVGGVDVRVAQARGFYLDNNLSKPGLWLGHILDAQRLRKIVNHRGFHCPRSLPNLVSPYRNILPPPPFLKRSLSRGQMAAVVPIRDSHKKQRTKKKGERQGAR